MTLFNTQCPINVNIPILHEVSLDLGSPVVIFETVKPNDTGLIAATSINSL